MTADSYRKALHCHVECVLIRLAIKQSVIASNPFQLMPWTRIESIVEFSTALEKFSLINGNTQETGQWRALNLTLPPFNLPEPIAMIDEKCTELDGALTDKRLAVWDLTEIRSRYAEQKLRS